MRLRFGPALDQTQRQSAQLAVSMRYLAMPSHELAELVAQTADANPALELVEVPCCLACGAQLTRRPCPVCVALAQSPRRPVLSAGAWLEPAMRPDPRRELISSLRAALPGPDAGRLAEILVGALDDRGFLRVERADLARFAGLPIARIEAALAVLRAVGPPGIGACSAAEMLDLQLAGQAISPLARRILTGHLEDLAAGRDELLAGLLRVAPEVIRAVRREIRLLIRPGRISLGSECAPLVRPDLVFYRTADGFGVELVEWEPRRPAIAASFRAAGPLTAEESAYVRASVAEARLFLYRLGQRRETLLALGRLLCARQADFLGGGELRPLTRSAAAGALGLHRTTVGRAAAAKSALLPTGRVVALDDLFLTPAEAKRWMIARSLAARPGAPDRELVEALRQKGLAVSRRSVAYHRARLGAPGAGQPPQAADRARSRRHEHRESRVFAVGRGRALPA